MNGQNEQGSAVASRGAGHPLAPPLFLKVGLWHRQSLRWKKQTSHSSFQGLPQFTAFFLLEMGKKKNPVLAVFLSPPAQKGAGLPCCSHPAVPVSLPICAHHMSITL